VKEEFGTVWLLTLIASAWICVVGVVFLSALWIGLL
jgi:hypothetical protein